MSNLARKIPFEVKDTELLQAFAEKYGVTPGSGRVCPGCLFGRKCTIGSCTDHELATTDGWDHETIWLKDGKPYMIVTHPYWTCEDRLFEWTKRLGLQYEIRPKDESWYYPGYEGTYMVLITAKG